MAKVPMPADAVNKSYYKYFEMGIADLTEEQKAFVAQCKRPSEEALSAKERNKFIGEGVWPRETGYYPLKEGGMLIAANVPMPDVTADMLYWWFAWHGLDPLRYAIWDCEDHFDVQIDEKGRALALDPSVPMEQKTWGATHVVLESMGAAPDQITIMFKNPAEMGFDPALIGTDSCEFLVSANCLLAPYNTPSHMVECAKKVDGVMTYMCRFWVGYHAIDGEAKCLLPPEVTIPDEVAAGMVGHCIKEFSNLAKILPSVYAEEKDRW